VVLDMHEVFIEVVVVLLRVVEVDDARPWKLIRLEQNVG